MTAPINNQIIMVGLTIVSLLLVFGITYVYTNRNKWVTFIFTLGALIAIAFIRLISVVDVRIHQNFIGSFNQDQLSYMVAGPGWQQLIYAWHIWVIPVFVIFLLMSVVFYVLWHYRRYGVKTDVILPQALAKAHETTHTEMGGDRLNHFMMIEAAKKEANQAKQKLAESLMVNAKNEILLCDFNLHVEELEQDLKEKNDHLKQQTEIVNLELQAKHKENQYLLTQLGDRNNEVERLQKMLEELLADEEK